MFNIPIEPEKPEKPEDSRQAGPEQKGNPIKVVLNVLFFAYVFFFWSFMFQDGQFTILHKRQPSLNNILIMSDSPRNLFGYLASEYAIRSQYRGVIISIGTNGVRILDFW
jgi:hypothetical protein